MLQALVTLVSVFKVSIGEWVRHVHRHITAKLGLLLGFPVEVGSSLNIYGASDENKVFILDLGDCLVSQDVLEQNSDDLAID